MPRLCEVRNAVILNLEMRSSFLQCKTIQKKTIILIPLCSLVVVIAADGVLKVGPCLLLWRKLFVSDRNHVTNHLSSVLDRRLTLVPVSSDL